MCYQAQPPRTNKMLDPETKRRIIHFLEKNHPKDFNLIEISDSLNIHRNTVRTYVKVLVAEKLIKTSRKIGNIMMYSSL